MAITFRRNKEALLYFRCEDRLQMLIVGRSTGYGKWGEYVKAQ